MSHYFSSRPETPVREQPVNVHLFDKRYPLLSASGMFSVGKLDKGAEVLIKNCEVSLGATVCDLGCAYGVVGILVADQYDATVTLLDVNARAIAYAKKNIAKNGLIKQCTAYVSDGFSRVPDMLFDVVLLNPPQHAGKQVCLRLIDEAYAHLKCNGSLQVVARHNKGGASLQAYMETNCGSVVVLARKAGFRLYQCIKKQS